MTPQELKASILQLAIQGKLVPQIPEEGTGEELYKQIQAEKQRLIKEGKIKKEKTLPEIADDEIPFDVPETWRWIRLGELIGIIGGVSYKKEDAGKHGIRILRGGNIQSMKVLLDEDDVFLPHEYMDKEKQVRVGDILIVASTGSKTVIGKAGYVDREMPETMIGAFLRICRPFYLETAEYLRCLFDSEFYRKHIRDLSQGTNINNVKESHITEFVVPIPPLAEQKRIVAKIEELLPLIDRYEKAWSELEEFNKRFPVDMQKSILQTALQGRLVAQFENDIPADVNLIKTKETEDYEFDIPENWRLAHLESVTYNIPSKRYQVLESEVQQTGKYPVISQSKEYSIGFSDDLDKVYHHTNPVIVFGDHTTEIKYVDFDFVVGADGVKIFEPIDEIITADFLFYVFRFYSKDLSKIGGYSRHYKFIKNKPIPLPPLAEQKRIVAKLEEILPLCEKLK